MTTIQDHSSTFDEDLMELLTTSPVEVTNQTTRSSMTSSSSRGVGFYFQCGVVVIGFAGTVANGLILYALIASGQHKKHVLIFNQNLLDFVSCFFLFTTRAVKLCNISLSGTRGYLLCVTVLSEVFALGPFISSLINLAAITIERYLKVVHHVWAKKNLHKWMIYLVIPFAWVGGNAIGWGWTIHTTAVVNGVCYTLIFWKSRTAQVAFVIWYCLSFYVGLFLLFLFCYGRILFTIRRQASVMSGHSGPVGSNTTRTQSKQLQLKIIKTMVLVSLLYVILWSPGYIFNLLMNIHTKLTVREVGFHIITVIGFLYNTINPFIYATNFDPVKRVLLRLIPWKRSLQPHESIEMT